MHKNISDGAPYDRREFFSRLGKGFALIVAARQSTPRVISSRSRTLIDDDWRFTKGDPPDNSVSLLYDVRPPAGARGETPASAPAPEVPVVRPKKEGRASISSALGRCGV
jgi:hypothetical protein